MKKVKTGTYISEGLKHLFLENDKLRIVVLPEIGGKMIRLSSQKTQRQYLLEPQNRNGSYHRPFYGAVFENYDTSGFDECFPTISESVYPFPVNNENIIFPDHGEVWSVPWNYSFTGSILELSVAGKKFNYEFRKEITLQDNQISIRYSLINLYDQPFYYIWSAHPLLKVTPGDQIFLSTNVEQLFLNWASESRLGMFGDKVPWPIIDSKHPRLDYSVVQEKSLAQAIKGFTNRLEESSAAVYFHNSGESLVFESSDPGNNYLGLWLCYGGWPEQGDMKHLTVAIEPCSGRPDTLEEAVRRGEAAVVQSQEKRSWQLDIKLETGVPSQLATHSK